MKNKLLFSYFFLSAVILLLSNCSKDSSPTEPSDGNSFKDSTNNDSVIVRKPNIYLYPKIKTDLSVKLVFPSCGRVIASTPEYSEGWQITAEPNGKINNAFDYLFYECSTPDLYQYSAGWVIKRDSLLIFFKTHLTETGFSKKEINDFTSYWIPMLSSQPFYTIYPQFSHDIEKLILLNITPPPDNIIRLYYVIKGSGENNIFLSQPPVLRLKREGFIAAEWGVILK